MWREKIIHAFSENVVSICIVAMFVVIEKQQDAVAIISLISSSTMTFILLFAGGCTVLHNNAMKDGDHMNLKLTLRKEDMDNKLSKRQLRKKFEELVPINPQCVPNFFSQEKAKSQGFLFFPFL